jgi:UDPglucose 6-dehydrogenase
MGEPESAVGVVGVGWVGLVSAACFAELGNRVVAVDIDAERIAALRQGELPFHEPRIDELLERNRERLRFVTEIDEVLAEAKLLF